MTDQDYAELRIRLMAHQVLLCAVLATHHDKAHLSVALTEVLDQIQSQLIASPLNDQTLEIFDKEIQSILNKSGLAEAGD